MAGPRRPADQLSPACGTTKQGYGTTGKLRRRLIRMTVSGNFGEMAVASRRAGPVPGAVSVPPRYRTNYCARARRPDMAYSAMSPGASIRPR